MRSFRKVLETTGVIQSFPEHPGLTLTVYAVIECLPPTPRPSVGQVHHQALRRERRLPQLGLCRNEQRHVRADARRGHVKVEGKCYARDQSPCQPPPCARTKLANYRYACARTVDETHQEMLPESEKGRKGKARPLSRIPGQWYPRSPPPSSGYHAYASSSPLCSGGVRYRTRKRSPK